MKINEILQVIQTFAPFQYQENYDNSGLLVGNPETEVDGALLSLDITEEVLEEARNKGFGLIIAHHPVIFSGIKRLTGTTYTERIVMKAIQWNIALLCVHTNLDNIAKGVNALLAEKLSLKNTRVLKPIPNTLQQLFVYVPTSHLDAVRNALFQAGAGVIGNYSECAFTSQGQGTFKPNEAANPFVGEKASRHEEAEVKLELVFSPHVKSSLLNALRESHPYEEIAFGIIPLQNSISDLGAGLIGELEAPLEATEFMQIVKEQFKVPVIRHTQRVKPIRTVALCGGSGSFLLSDAIQAGADVFITGDYKYHQFFDADGKIMIMDIGHYESEQFTPEIFYRLVTKKFPTFALQITSVNTNPVNYF